MHVALAGQLPGALETRSGIISAPDPTRAPSTNETAYGSSAPKDNSYTPDRDTRRPELSAYDDPFTPPTAPFKRMQAFDAVGADYKLRVSDEHQTTVPVSGTTGPGDDVFYANMVVDVAPGRGARIPSVGPGSRIVRASLTNGGEEVNLRIVRDGAENWFLDAPGARASFKGRLVMELSIARGAFGGPMADVAWDRLSVPALPPNVEKDAAQVRSAIGVNHDMRPRVAVAKLVNYFRSFEDTDQPLAGKGSIYLDLALSKKGVCRHRAFSFLVTALSLGIPTRFVMNDAHAWVEVSDGFIWKRIDLGGAGHMANQPRSEAGVPAYEAQADVFPWPKSGERGEDMINDARSEGMSPARTGAPAPSGSNDPGTGLHRGSDAEREKSDKAVTLAVTDAEPHRGQPLHVSGEVRSEGLPCAHAAVTVWLRQAKTLEMTQLGTLATGEDGTFAGSVVVPSGVTLGPYDVVARTASDERCGAGH
jgi:transglutaminase-like putative cysteine protease